MGHPMRPNDSRVLAVAAALVGLVDALSTERRGDHPDELVAFPFGFERRAASALVRQGKLATKKIGRRSYARRSDVLALVEVPAKAAPDVAKTTSDATAAARAAYARPSLRVLRGAR